MFASLALVVALCVTAVPMPASAQDVPLEIFDHYSNNSLVYEPFNSLFSQKGSVSFDTLDFTYHPYSNDSPVLIVYRPSESSNEHYGYYFPKGFSSFSSYGGAEYEPIRQYFGSGQFEAYTPFAARFAHPHFYQNELTKFVHGQESSTYFNVVFLVPKVPHPYDYVTYYNSIVAPVPLSDSPLSDAFRK